MLFLVKAKSSFQPNREKRRTNALKTLDYIALTLVIIGAVNWGLIGFFNWNLVAALFGSMSWLSRIIYAIVGLCGLYLISMYMKIGTVEES